MEHLERAPLRPCECSGLLRLGRADGDGGYVVPRTAVERATWLLSLGLSDEWSFDEDFLRTNTGARLIGVDHSIGRAFFAARCCTSLLKLMFYALTLNTAKMHKWRRRLRASIRYFSLFAPPHRHIARKVGTKRSGAQISLTELLALTESGSRHDVFLKMDIEGSEYEIIPEIACAHERLSCVAAEFHDLDHRTAEFNDAVRQLQEHFAVVHVHGNNFRPYDMANDFPTVVEMTFLNRELLGGTPPARSESYPLEGLDAPNNPSKPDYALNFD